jgi:ABC-type multidrug transport system ATPase subunit
VNSAPGIQANNLSIAVDKLSKRFNREWIFQDVNYLFLSGHTYAVTGPNGSGKSTFLQVLWGQVPQSSGRITYTKGTRFVPVEEVFEYLSIATPYMDLVEEFTLEEMLHFHFRLKKIRQGYTVEELLDIMYLEDAADKQLFNFSSGMKQRLKLGLAFYTQADVYFLDEPGTNLDRQAFEWYMRELQALPEKAIVFIASNNAEEYPATATLLNIMDFKRRSRI